MEWNGINDIITVFFGFMESISIDGMETKQKESIKKKLMKQFVKWIVNWFLWLMTRSSSSFIKQIKELFDWKEEWRNVEWIAFLLLLCGWVMGRHSGQWLRPKEQTKKEKQFKFNKGRKESEINQATPSGNSKKSIYWLNLNGASVGWVDWTGPQAADGSAARQRQQKQQIHQFPRSCERGIDWNCFAGCASLLLFL